MNAEHEEHHDGGAAGAPPSGGPEPQLAFPPVENGLDYLASVVHHLDKNQSKVTPRDLKYAVLHLQAAVEILLKARLMIEHWSLVFSKPGDANRPALDKADFASVSIDDLIKRLRNIAGVPITPDEKSALTEVKERRNQLQHFGLTAPAPAIEAHAGEVLDFLIRFLDGELLPRLDERKKEQAERALEDLRGGLTRIEAFVRKRLDRIGGELESEGVEDRTIQCPRCRQLTLVFDEASLPDDAGAGCRFCTDYLGLDSLLDRFGPGSLLDYLAGEPDERHTCPRCGEWTLGWGIRMRLDPDRDVAFCFTCCTALPHLVHCTMCDRPIEREDGPDLCGSCYDRVIDEARYGRETFTDYDDAEEEA